MRLCTSDSEVSSRKAGGGLSPTPGWSHQKEIGNEVLDLRANLNDRYHFRSPNTREEEWRGEPGGREEDLGKSSAGVPLED